MQATGLKVKLRSVNGPTIILEAANTVDRVNVILLSEQVGGTGAIRVVMRTYSLRLVRPTNRNQPDKLASSVDCYSGQLSVISSILW